MPDDDAAGRHRQGATDPDEGTAEDPTTGADEADESDEPAEADPEDADAKADDADADADADGERRAPLWIETVVLLGVALVMALVIKTFFVQAFYIPSESMEPGLVTNDRILVQKTSYWFGEPDRGDVVVFEDPGGWLTGPVMGPQTWLAKGLAKIGLYPTGGHLVKRVIGVAGDTITCCDEQGRIAVNGEPIDEDDFIAPQPDTSCDGPMAFGGSCTVGGDGAGRPAVRHGRQPRRLGGLLGAAVQAAAAPLRRRPGLCARRPGGGQGLRPGVAARPRRVRRHAGRVRRRAGPLTLREGDQSRHGGGGVGGDHRADVLGARVPRWSWRR